MPFGSKKKSLVPKQTKSPFDKRLELIYRGLPCMSKEERLSIEEPVLDADYVVPVEYPAVKRQANNRYAQARLQFLRS